MVEYNIRPKLLMVDDIPDNLIALRQIFSHLDVEIFEAENGNDALSLTLEHDFALILLDVQMPDMDGYEVASLLRNAEHSRHIPIIFITANSREMANELRGYNSGAIDYITKPINRTIILSKVELFLNLYRQKEMLKLLNDDLLAARKQADEANATKSRFLANMSHEIRTPMNGMIGMIELLTNTALDEKQKRYATLAHKCGQDLVSLVGDILDFSKIEAGELELEITDFNLHELLKETVEVTTILAAKNEVTLHWDNKLNGIEYVCGDMHRVRQVLNNLINNAIKFSHGGNVILCSKLEKQEDETAEIRFEVSDTGIGIPMEKQHLLFQKFSQIDVSTTRKFGGTGLGLAICRLLVELMGGEIGVTSEEGKGSTFWFTVPFQQKTSYAENIPTVHGNENILFVGMNPLNVDVFVEYVEKWNVAHDVAASLSLAIDLMYHANSRGDPYTTVIVGEEIPEHDRLMLAHAIKNDEGFKDCNVLLITSTGYGDEWNKYAKVGFTKNLTLPVNQNGLLQSLRSAGGRG